VATDGHRLAYASLVAGGLAGADAASANRSSRARRYIELSRLLATRGDSDATVEFGTNQVRFRFGDIRTRQRSDRRAFPDYNRVIPTRYQD
jgi:DNA polymerase III sliding clamp (beta) subunit (PCNA family)